MSALTGCEGLQKRDHSGDRSGSVSTLKETSLKSDKEELEELRKNIPEEKRRSNDQLKEILALTVDVSEPPSRVREKFSRIVRRMRDQHRREINKEREGFSRNERRAREEFQRKAQDERKKFNARKKESKNRDDFYSQQDRERRDFYAEQNRKRDEFNSDIRLRVDDFNAMIRERERDFQMEIKDYDERYKQIQVDRAAQRESKKEEIKEKLSNPTEELKTGP